MSDPLARGKSWFTGGGVGWPLCSLLALLFFNLAVSPGFFALHWQNGQLYGSLVDVFNQGSKVMLLALGMTLVIATNGVDLSVGSVMAIAGALAALLVTQTALPFAAVVGLAVLACAALGAGNGLLIAALGVQPIVATLITMVIGRGVAMLVTGGQIVTFEHPGFVFLGNGRLLGLPFTLAIVALMFAATWWLARRNAIGLFIEATGGNETAARFCGVPTAAIRVAVYAWSGGCAALAGLIAASNIKAADSSRAGETMELDAIFAVVAGGTALTGGRFSLAGSWLGALLIQTLTTTMYNLGVPPAIAPVPKSVVIVFACLLQSAKFRALFSSSRGKQEAAA